MISFGKLSLLKNTPSFWAFVYFAQIVIFAFIYLQISSQFYHSTSLNEPSLQEDERALEHILERIIYAKLIDSEDFEIPQIYVSIEFESRHDVNIMISNILGGSIANGELRLFRKGLDEGQLFMAFDFLNFHSGAQAQYNDKGNVINEYGTMVPATDGQWGSFEIIPDPTLLELYLGWRAAHTGQPSRKNGLIIRSLYLSVVTTTTLGYGDIVPLTSLARLLVAIQTILGVVITAVFLNALLNRRG
jgi:hypothetical protein